MTRRERLQNRLAKREEWSASRSAKATSSFNAAHRVIEGIPPGQPILVGHHSERHHRRDLARHDGAMHRGIEHQDMASHHAGKAAGIERQLDQSIFSDDPDAIEQLEAKLAGLEAEQERDKTINALVRKAKRTPDPAATLAILLEAALGSPGKENDPVWPRLAVKLLTPDFDGRVGIPAYALSNRSGNMTRIRERIKSIKAMQERTATAEVAGGVVVERWGDSGLNTFARVTFAEKPDRSVINELKAAGYYWGNGSWQGYTDKLPACVAAMENTETPEQH